MAWKQVKDTQELLRVFMIMFEQFSSYVCAFGKNKNDILQYGTRCFGTASITLFGFF